MIEITFPIDNRRTGRRELRKVVGRTRDDAWYNAIQIGGLHIANRLMKWSEANTIAQVGTIVYFTYESKHYELPIEKVTFGKKGNVTLWKGHLKQQSGDVSFTIEGVCDDSGNPLMRIFYVLVKSPRGNKSIDRNNISFSDPK